MIAWKFLAAGRLGPFTGFAWPVGEWVAAPEGAPDDRWIHACRASDLPYWVPGWPGAELVAALDLEGVEVSAGSACSAGTPEPSPVLTEMLGAERAQSSIRASLGDATTAADLEYAITTLRRVLGARGSSA